MSTYSSLSPLAYNSYLSGPDVGGVMSYSQTKLLISDAYKEQQYWLSVYNRAQQFGLNNTSIEDIITQLTRVGEKLNFYQNIVLPANENRFKYENETNQGIKKLFESSGNG